MNCRLFVFIILLLALRLNVFSDGIELRSRQMGTNDGLPSNSVRCMYQDSKGFLWMGTLNGLSRYDGNSFLTFQPEPNKPERISLADNRINKLLEDKNGFLWIGTFPELYSCYDLQNARFVDYTGDGGLEQNYSNIFIASNGDVWLWSKRNGGRQVTTAGDRSMTSVEYKLENGNLSHNNVQFITEDKAGRIWIGTQKGLTLVSDGKAVIKSHTHNFKSSFIYKQDVYFITEGGTIYNYNASTNRLEPITDLSKLAGKLSVTGTILLKDKCILSTSVGSYEYNFQKREMKPYPRLNIKRGLVICDNYGDYWVYNHTGHVYYILAETEIIKDFQFIPEERLNYIDYERYNIVHDSRGIVWISTYGNGLFAYDTSTDKLEHFTSDESGSGPIGSDFLLYVMEDKAGGIWVSSEYSGLSRISIVNEGITRFYPEARGVLDRSNSIRILYQAQNGDICVGTRKGGLYTYDSQLNPKGEKQSFQASIYAINEDSSGHLWFGTRGAGLKIGDNWHHRTPSDSTTLAHSHIFGIYRDRKDRMWIGTFGGGLDLAVPVGEGKYQFKHFLQETAGLRGVRTIAEDKNGMMWVGTSDGICIFHPDSLITDATDYKLFSLTNGKFCSNGIKYILRDSKGRMWVGTAGAGLSLCEATGDYASLKYKSYGTSEGLVNDAVQTILEDKEGLLWIATEYGISKFNPSSHSFENYYFSSFAQGNVYGENCACLCADGKLLFGTEYGLTLVDPKKVGNNESVSPVVFTSLRINGTLASPDMEDSPLRQSLSYSGEISLKYFQNTFLLDFSTLDYSDRGQTKYMYWLENYDKGWSAPSPLNFASYKYLDPGTYVLHVKSCNGAGIWNEKETTLRITIVPPFWKTGWAMAGYFLLIIIALYLSYRIARNFNKLRNRIDVEKQLTEYKLIFFTNISHEFRTPLTLIQGALEKMQRAGSMPRELLSPLQTMDKSTRRMLRLINQLLEFRKMQNNKMALSLEETDVVAFLYEIFLSFGDVAEQKNMDFRFLPSVASYKMYIDKGSLDKVAYNLLSNAFKYTPSGGTILFVVNVDVTKKQILFQVSDTGVGIPKEKQNELFKRFMQSSFSGDSIGVGLHLSRELVTVHKGTIEYKENEGGGSVFTVCLPTDKAVYEEKDFLIPGNVLLKEAEDRACHLQELTEELPEIERVVPLNKRKVLIIEDDNDIRELLRTEIGAYFEVEVAADGNIGFEKACTYDADLIICDVLMPGMTGFEVTRKLKSDFATSHIPIVLLTALNSPEKQLEGIEAGADAYISKPFSIKLLLARVFQLIEQREKLREKFSNEPGIVHTAMYSTDKDKEFVERLILIIEAHISNPDFSVEEFAQLMKLGRTVFYKKVRGVTGYSPNEYLRIVRMKKAAELLLSEEKYTVAEVAYKVGVNDPFYFSKCFKTQFGISPSVYQKGGKVVEESAE